MNCQLNLSVNYECCMPHFLVLSVQRRPPFPRQASVVGGRVPPEPRPVQDQRPGCPSQASPKAQVRVLQRRRPQQIRQELYVHLRGRTKGTYTLTSLIVSPSLWRYTRNIMIRYDKN